MTPRPRAARRPTRAQVVRRRRVAALVAIASVTGLLAVAWPSQDALEPALTGSSRRSPAPSDEATTSGEASGSVAVPTDGDDPSPPPEERYVAPPAWLAWVSGGFDPSFRATSTSLRGFRRTVVVAGDTLWLTGSTSSDGRVLDDPRPPYRIPIDAFAVDPTEYEPFVGTSVRELVVRTLRRGEAVVGTSSAKLRRIDVGGTLNFGGDTITVGAIVPDDAVGWSEVMVNRSIGRSLGITHDRYLLGLTGNTSLTEPAFEATVAKLLPAGTAIRVDAPGSTPYVRVASGVRPAVVMKQVFGEFSARVASDGVTLDLDPRWVDEHIVSRTVPLLGKVTCHRKLFAPLLAALEDLESRGLGHLVEVYSGCWVARTIARSSTAPPSYHSYGAAIDINAPTNPYGQPPNQDPRLVEAFEAQGFNWGGDFLIPDGHHFEYWGPPGDGAPR